MPRSLELDLPLQRKVYCRSQIELPDNRVLLRGTTGSIRETGFTVLPQFGKDVGANKVLWDTQAVRVEWTHVHHNTDFGLMLSTTPHVATVSMCQLTGPGVEHRAVLAGLPALAPRVAVWAVRDTTGRVHTALVTRDVSRVEDRVTTCQVGTVCHPRDEVMFNEGPEDWCGTGLPAKLMEWGEGASFTIRDWNVRAAPTCLHCINGSDRFNNAIDVLHASPRSKVRRH